MALQLIYLMFSRFLGWMVLRTRCDTTKDIELLVLRTNSPCSDGARRGRG